MSTAEPPVELVPLSAIIADTATQARVSVNEDTIEDYSQKFDKLPPIDLFASEREPGRYYIGDGWHRYYAAEKAGRDSISGRVHRQVEVIKANGETTGEMRPVRDGRREAILWSLKANGNHGLPRTRKDVQNAIRIALEDPELKDRPSRYIARLVECNHETVEAARKRLHGDDQGVRTISRNGQDVRMDTSNIGRRERDDEEASPPPALSSWVCEMCGHRHDGPGPAGSSR